MSAMAELILIPLYHYLLLATIVTDEFAINNTTKKNSTSFLTLLGWEFNTARYTCSPNDFCSLWVSPYSKNYHHHQLSQCLHFPAHAGSTNTSSSKVLFVFQVQLHAIHPISPAAYTSLKSFNSCNTRPCPSHSGRTHSKEAFWSSGWDVISLCDHKYLMATQELDSYNLLGEREGAALRQHWGLSVLAQT